MVHDYRYLIIKNNCPLPLILDIVEKIDIKNVFTKLGLYKCIDKEGRQVKSSIQNAERVF